MFGDNGMHSSKQSYVKVEINTCTYLDQGFSGFLQSLQANT